MFIALTNEVENRKVICTGQSKGQVRRILVQMGLNPDDYIIIDPVEEFDRY